MVDGLTLSKMAKHITLHDHFQSFRYPNLMLHVSNMLNMVLVRHDKFMLRLSAYQSYQRTSKIKLCLNSGILARSQMVLRSRSRLVIDASVYATQNPVRTQRLNKRYPCRR
jgi:hypothetical protein